MAEDTVRVTEARHGSTVVLNVVGRVDHNSANTFQAAVAPVLARCAAGGDALVIDLAGMDYISSAGLRVFMIMSRECKARQGRIVLAAMQPLVREIFDISKFTLLFEIHASVDAALAALRAAGETGA